MIMLDFLIGFFAVFIAPYIFLYYKYSQLNSSIILFYSFILSLTGVWVTVLASYYFNLPNVLIYILAVILSVLSLVYMYRHRDIDLHKKHQIVMWMIAVILLLPLLKYAGTGFTEWDALVSWHKWALDLYNNEYHPINAAYPVLMPSLLAIIYKIQGTSQIWWTAKLAYFVLPVVSLVLPLSLYHHYKNKIFLFIAIFLYPYLLMRVTIEGAMDMPVMLMGMLTLIALYSAEINKNNREFELYIYASLLLSGLASITKQGGLAFIVFDIIYILLNLKYFTNIKRLIIVIIATSLYFLSFLTIYYLNAIAGVTGNLKLLKSLSAYTFEHKDLLWRKFFSYPPDIPILEPLSNLFHLQAITPYLLGISFLIFIFRGSVKKYNTVAILSIVFLVIGFFAWGKYASYHERNSYWVKTFLIMFVSIQFSYFVTWYQKKKFSTIYIFIPFILFITIYLGSFGNIFVEKKQKAFQSKLGWEELAKDVVNIVKDKNPCLHIYTNDYTLLYNYHTRNIQEKITAQEFNTHNLYKIIENTCEEGVYITFRGSTHSYALWKNHIQRLIYDKKILPYNGDNSYLFFIPPHTKLPIDYFDNRTVMVHKKIDNFDNNVSFNIEDIKDNNNSYNIKGWAFVKNAQIDKSEKYIVLTKGKEEYIVATNIQLRPDVTVYFKAKNLSKSGFKSYIYKKDFSEGIYLLSILLIDKNKKQHFIKTNKTIKIKYNDILEKKRGKNER